MQAMDHEGGSRQKVEKNEDDDLARVNEDQRVTLMKTATGGEMDDSINQTSENSNHEKMSTENSEEILTKFNQCCAPYIPSDNQSIHRWTRRGEKKHNYANYNTAITQLSEPAMNVNTQTREKPFKCHLCDKSYNHSSDLSKHKRAHSGEKPYKCLYCDKAFIYSNDLKKHTRTHTGEKPYKCLHCESAFKNSHALLQHTRRLHTGEKPYKCVFCDKEFVHSYDLTKHVRIHTGEKPYECTYCDKAFSKSDHLIRHERIHTGEKPYTCEHCNENFTRSENLKRHKCRSVHLTENPSNSVEPSDVSDTVHK